MAKELARGIGAHGRSKSYHRRGLWAIKKKNGGKFPTTAKQEKAAEPAGKVGTAREIRGWEAHCSCYEASVGGRLRSLIP